MKHDIEKCKWSTQNNICVWSIDEIGEDEGRNQIYTECYGDKDCPTYKKKEKSDV